MDAGHRKAGGESVVETERSTSFQPPDTIAVIIPTALQRGSNGRPLLEGCLESLEAAIESPDQRASDGGPYLREVIVVTQGYRFEGNVIERLTAAGVQVRQFDILGPFNFSKKVNAGTANAASDVAFLLNDDAVMRGADWPAVFLGILADPSVGAVGPIIRNPDGTLNAAGDTHSADGVRHVDGFDLRYRPGLAKILAHDHEVSLLTAAALAVPMLTFRSIGEFDEAYPSALGDSDFSVRLRASGLHLVCTPRVVVTHAEASSRDPRVPASTLRRFQRMHPESSRQDVALPPLALPPHVQLARSVVRPLRGAYRVTIKRLVPRRVHLRLWRAAVSRGWVR